MGDNLPTPSFLQEQAPVKVYESENSVALQKAVMKYKTTSELLQDKLSKFFMEHEKKTNGKCWKPSISLRKPEDVCALNDSAGDMNELIEKLVAVFEPHRKESRLSPFSHGIVKLLGWVTPPLKNFLTVAKDAQSVLNLLQRLLIHSYIDSNTQSLWLDMRRSSYVYCSRSLG